MMDIQGHRGARGLAPENTLIGFATAIRLGVSTLELDAAVTKDGIVVISHDRRLNADITRDMKGLWLSQPTPLIHQITLDELSLYEVGRIRPESTYARRFPQQIGHEGVRVPTLRQLFQMARESDVRFNVETKISPTEQEESVSPEDFVTAILEVTVSEGMASRTTIQSFDWRTLQIAQKTGIPVTLSYLTSSDSIFPNSPWTAGFDVSAYPSLPELVRQAAHNAYSAVWSPAFSTVTAELVWDAHARGLRVIPWTINETAELMRAFSLRVDGLITDYPDAAITAWRKCTGRTSQG